MGTSQPAGGQAPVTTEVNGTLPLGPAAVVLTRSGIIVELLIPLVILLFPDGRLPSLRWRWTVWVYLATAVLGVAGVFAGQAVGISGQHVRINAGGRSTMIWPTWCTRPWSQPMSRYGSARAAEPWLAGQVTLGVVAVSGCYGSRLDGMESVCPVGRSVCPDGS